MAFRQTELGEAVDLARGTLEPETRNLPFGDLAGSTRSIALQFFFLLLLRTGWTSKEQGQVFVMLSSGTGSVISKGNVRPQTKSRSRGTCILTPPLPAQLTCFVSLSVMAMIFTSNRAQSVVNSIDFSSFVVRPHAVRRTETISSHAPAHRTRKHGSP